MSKRRDSRNSASMTPNCICTDTVERTRSLPTVGTKSLIFHVTVPPPADSCCPPTLFAAHTTPLMQDQRDASLPLGWPHSHLVGLDQLPAAVSAARWWEEGNMYWDRGKLVVIHSITLRSAFWAGKITSHRLLLHTVFLSHHSKVSLPRSERHTDTTLKHKHTVIRSIRDSDSVYYR